MATVDEHLAQSEHNLSVAQLLADSASWDWAVTALFYAALHLCQAYMIRQGVTVASHRARHRQMLLLPELRQILDAYRNLRNDSEHVRYECRRFSRAEYELIRVGSFAAVTTHLRSLLGVS